MGVKRQKLFLFLLIWSLDLVVCRDLIWADTFRLTSILPAPSCDNAGDPSLNDKGELLFRCDGRYFFYNGISFTDLTPVISPLINSLSIVSLSRLNNLSQIAFIGQDKDTGRYDIYLYDGSHITNITGGIDITLVYTVNNRLFLPNPQLNDNGQMVFTGKDPATGRRDLYFYDGSEVSNLTSPLDILPSIPSLNNFGQIAFTGQNPSADRYDIYFYAGNKISNLTADSDIASGKSVSSLLNDKGQIVIWALDRNGAANIYFFDGISITNITHNSDIMDIIGGFSLNDKGQIAIIYWDVIRGNGVKSYLYFYDNSTLIKTIPVIGLPTIMHLNNKGQIVFYVVTALRPEQGPVLLFFYDGQELKQLTNNYCPCESLSLNDKGQMALSSSGTRFSQAGVYLYNEGNIKNVTTDLTPFRSSQAVSLNNQGQIAFLATDNLYFYNGNAIENITADLDIIEYQYPFTSYNHYPSLNDKGQIAFIASDNKGQTNLYFYDGTKLDKIKTEGIVPISPPSLNDNGQIAFFGTDTTGRRAIYFYDGSSTNLKFNVDDSSSDLTLNNKGQIAYSSSGGIYFYDGTKVINITEGLGDISLGSGNMTTRHSLNNKGQIAFYGYGDASKILYFYLYDPASVDKIKIIQKFKPYRINYDIPLSLNDKTQLGFILGYNQVYLAKPLPVAQAGADQIVAPGFQITLDGSGSYDLDGDSLNYRWLMISKPIGSKAILSDPTASKPTFIGDVGGIYEVQLMVDDGKERSDSDSVFVIGVEPTDSKPLAYAGTDRVVTTGRTITLDGSTSYNPKGEDLSYNWSLVTRPPDSQATLTDPTSRNLSLKPDKDGLYKINLIIRNSQGQSATDTIDVFALGGDTKLMVGTSKSQYQFGDTLELYIWAGNSSSALEVKADVFIGFGLPNEALYFFDSSLNLKPANPTDPRSFIPFTQNVTLSPGSVFPGSAEMSSDSDGNGKLDTYRLFAVTLPPTLPPGPYFAFAALAEPGTAQSGSPQLLNPISLAYFSFTR